MMMRGEAPQKRRGAAAARDDLSSFKFLLFWGGRKESPKWPAGMPQKRGACARQIQPQHQQASKACVTVSDVRVVATNQYLLMLSSLLD
jgi:hypothetical protein